MTIESFAPRKEFAVVSTRYEDLCVVSNSGLEKRQRPLREFVGFEEVNFEFGEVVAWFVLKFSASSYQSLVRRSMW